MDLLAVLRADTSEKTIISLKGSRINLILQRKADINPDNLLPPPGGPLFWYCESPVPLLVYFKTLNSNLSKKSFF